MNFAAFVIGEWKKFKSWCESELSRAKTDVSELRARVTTLEDKVMELEKKL